MKKNRYLCSGAAGFIGSNLVEYLLEHDPECEIIGIDNLSTGKMSNMDGFIKNPRFKFRWTDLSHSCWSEGIKDAYYHEIQTDIDCVFHLSSVADVLPSIENPEPYFQASVVGTHNLLEWMRKNKIKNIVYSASSSCYGNADVIPTPEDISVIGDGYDPGFKVKGLADDVQKHLAPYATFKWVAEREIEYYCKEYDINAISLRYFNVYGPRMAKSGQSAYGMVMAIFLAQHFHNHPLTRVGDGKQKRDFVYVQDVCKLNEWAAQCLLLEKNKRKYDHYNVGSGNPTSINELIELINNNKNVMDLPARTNEAMTTHADVSKIKREYKKTTGQELEFTSIKEGVEYLMIHEAEYFKNAPYPKYEYYARRKNTNFTRL